MPMRGWWVARGQAGPTPLVVEVAASVTPCRHDTGPTVLDKRRQPDACGSAANLGSDVVGTDQITVPGELAVVAVELAAAGLGDPLLAGGAGGGGAPLVHQPHHDPGLLGLVAQGLEQVGTAPLSQPPVLQPTRILVGDSRRVPGQQRADPLLDGEGDDLLGGLMVGVVDAAAMPRLGTPDSGSLTTPPPRAALSRLGRSPGDLDMASLLIPEVKVALGADGAPRHQQPGLLGDDGVGVDDPEVDPCHPTQVKVVELDGDGGGDCSHNRPPSASSVTARISSAGYGSGRARRTQSSGWPLATGSRTRFPSGRKVPW
jgi:hypothetical protein